MKTYKLVILLFILFAFNACDNKQEEEKNTPVYENIIKNDKKTYIFGIHPLLNSKRLFEVYQPLVDLINEEIPEINMKLESSRNYASYNQKLFAGKFDISLPNPYQTLKSLEHGYKVFGKMGDDENFRGVILVRNDSSIKEVKDLIGKKLAFPAPTALAATMMPQYFMKKHGVDITKDTINTYVGTHESSILNVFLKKSDASSTWPLAWKAFIEKRPEIAKEVSIKWDTEPLVNNGLIVKNGTPKNILKKIEKIFFTLHENSRGRAILEPMKISKYEEANEKTFKIVENFLIDFEKNVRPIQITK